MRDSITVTLSKLNQLAQSTAQYRMSDRASKCQRIWHFTYRWFRLSSMDVEKVVRWDNPYFNVFHRMGHCSIHLHFRGRNLQVTETGTTKSIRGYLALDVWVDKEASRTGW
jgi:hypothetical protein